jgi:hypothetical protein
MGSRADYAHQYGSNGESSFTRFWRHFRKSQTFATDTISMLNVNSKFA